MSDRQKDILINFCIGCVIAVLVVWMNWDRDLGLFHRLCDGFFVAAVMLLGSGGLKYARNQGMFDMMSYGVQSVFQLYMPGTRKNTTLDGRPEEFVDYKERKRSERKSSAGLLWAGLGHAIISGVCFAVYLLGK